MQSKAFHKERSNTAQGELYVRPQRTVEHPRPSQSLARTPTGRPSRKLAKAVSQGSPSHMDEHDIQRRADELARRRESIEGYLQLKRRGGWARRYVIIDGSSRTFSYKNEASDPTEKLTIDLKTAKITKGTRNGYEPYIAIHQNRKNVQATAGDVDSVLTADRQRAGDSASPEAEENEVIRLAFDTEKCHRKWYDVALLASFSDKELLVYLKMAYSFTKMTADHQEQRTDGEVQQDEALSLGKDDKDEGERVNRFDQDKESPENTGNAADNFSNQNYFAISFLEHPSEISELYQGLCSKFLINAMSKNWKLVSALDDVTVYTQTNMYSYVKQLFEHQHSLKRVVADLTKRLENTNEILNAVRENQNSQNSFLWTFLFQSIVILALADSVCPQQLSLSYLLGCEKLTTDQSKGSMYFTLLSVLLICSVWQFAQSCIAYFFVSNDPIIHQSPDKPIMHLKSEPIIAFQSTVEAEFQTILQELSNLDERYKWDPNAEGISKWNEQAFCFKAKKKEDSQVTLMVLQQYEYFVESGTLFIIEKQRTLDQQEFKMVRLWVHEAKARRFTVFWRPDKRLMEFVGEHELVSDCLTTVAAFKSHLKMARNSRSAANKDDLLTSGARQPTLIPLYPSLLESADDTPQTSTQPEESSQEHPGLDDAQGATKSRQSKSGDAITQNGQHQQNSSTNIFGYKEPQQENEGPPGPPSTNDGAKKVTEVTPRKSYEHMMAQDFDFDPNVFLWDLEMVQDWDERIAHYSESQKAYYHHMVPKLGELKALAEESSEEWQALSDDKKKNILVESKRNPVSQLMMMRAMGPIGHAPIDVWRTICCFELTSDWDDGKEESQWTKKYGVNAYGMYTRTKKVMVVEGRDFVLNFMFNMEADGTILVAVIDTEDQEILDKYPPRRGVTRAGLPMSGWVIRPDPADPANKCIAQLICEIDMNGTFPGWVMNLAFLGNGKLIDNLRRTTAKFKEKFKSRYEEK